MAYGSFSATTAEPDVDGLANVLRYALYTPRRTILSLTRSKEDPDISPRTGNIPLFL
ncbi:hypothetical protein TorRG33x02_171240 [Trema orientale]|uniref:Uncharacterized protein n=1 Tax=Trema orientale TaxID=63057 RepID=A0A2P5ENX5_TREOI|nr:hypothetical protein TorRG33x02_171240 [Trema orientale]